MLYFPGVFFHALYRRISRPRHVFMFFFRLDAVHGGGSPDWIAARQPDAAADCRAAGYAVAYPDIRPAAPSGCCPGALVLVGLVGFRGISFGRRLLAPGFCAHWPAFVDA